MNDKLFDDFVTSLNQAIQHEKGEIQLEETVVEFSDEEMSFR
jgi:hypothetical protein